MKIFFWNTFLLIFSSNEVWSMTKLSCPEVDSNQEIQEFKIMFNLEPRNMNPQFNPELKTVVLIHGFLENSSDDWITKAIENLLDLEPMNVITVDYSDVYENVNHFNYGMTALATEIVAINLSNLGAHIAGLAGRHLLNTYNIPVDRITGLDPAYKCFEEKSAQLKLRRDDARFVDVIHTTFFQRGEQKLGSHEPIGDVDFYPNGGSQQPRCRHTKTIGAFKETMRNAPAIAKPVAGFISNIARNIARIDIEDIVLKHLTYDYNQICEHREATTYFIESLRGTRRFFANAIDELPVNNSIEMQCINRLCTDSTCIEMGINADKYRYAIGAYYVDTTSDLLDCEGMTIVDSFEADDKNFAE